MCPGVWAPVCVHVWMCQVGTRFTAGPGWRGHCRPSSPPPALGKEHSALSSVLVLSLEGAPSFGSPRQERPSLATCSGVLALQVRELSGEALDQTLALP